MIEAQTEAAPRSRDGHRARHRAHGPLRRRRSVTPEIEAAVRAQAAKRVAMQFVPERVASWDHRKLGGLY